MKKYIITVSEVTEDQEPQLINVQDIPESIGEKDRNKNTNATSDKLLLSPAEAAKILGVGLPKLYELVHAQGFPSFRLGRRIVISHDGLREWIRKQVKIYSDDCL